MSLLTENQKITKTLGYIKSFKFVFEDENLIEIDNDLYLVSPKENREDISTLNTFYLKGQKYPEKMELFGTFVLHKLACRRALRSSFESFYKFYNLQTAIKLLTYKKCESVMEMSYDDSVTPIHFYEPSIRERSLYTEPREMIDSLSPKDVGRLRNLYKAIEYNTKPDAHTEEHYTRLNNALRFYNHANDTKWHLMKLALFFIALESLFSDKDDHDGVSYKVRLRASYLLYPEKNDSDKRKKLFDMIKHGYDIRSHFLHGSNVQRVITQKQKKHKIGQFDYLSDYLPVLNEITSNIILKILENKSNLNFFSKDQDSTDERLFFSNLVL